MNKNQNSRVIVLCSRTEKTKSEKRFISLYFEDSKVKEALALTMIENANAPITKFIFKREITPP